MPNDFPFIDYNKKRIGNSFSFAEEWNNLSEYIKNVSLNYVDLGGNVGQGTTGFFAPPLIITAKITGTTAGESGEYTRYTWERVKEKWQLSTDEKKEIFKGWDGQVTNDPEYMTNSTDCNMYAYEINNASVDTNSIVELISSLSGYYFLFKHSGGGGSITLPGPYSVHMKAGLQNTYQTVKASAGTLYGYYLHNPHSLDTFVQIYDHASPSVGTTSPKLSIGVPAEGAANLEIWGGISFATAITIAGTASATGGSSAGGGGLNTNIFYT